MQRYIRLTIVLLLASAGVSGRRTRWVRVDPEASRQHRGQREPSSSTGDQIESSYERSEATWPATTVQVPSVASVGQASDGTRLSCCFTLVVVHASTQ